MKRFLSIGTMAVLLLSIPSAMAGNGKLEQILSQMQEYSKTLHAIHASIAQEKLHVQTGGIETYHGNLIFKRVVRGKDKIRIDYQKTNHVVAVDGEKITLYQPKVNQAFITCRAALTHDHPDYSFVTALYASVNELKARYAISYVRDETFEGAGTSLLEMIPKAKSAEVKTVLWVSQQTWMPIRFQVTERNGDVTTLTLREIVKNGEISDGAFRVSWPPRTNVREECK